MMHHTGIKNSEKREYIFHSCNQPLSFFSHAIRTWKHPWSPRRRSSRRPWMSWILWSLNYARTSRSWLQAELILETPGDSSLYASLCWHISIFLPLPPLSLSLFLPQSLSLFLLLPSLSLALTLQFLSFSICTHLSVSDCLLVFLSLSFPFLYAINIPKSLPLLCLFQTQQKALSIWTPQVNGLILLFINEVVPWFKWNSWFWL